MFTATTIVLRPTIAHARPNTAIQSGEDCAPPAWGGPAAHTAAGPTNMAHRPKNRNNIALITSTYNYGTIRYILRVPSMESPDYVSGTDTKKNRFMRKKGTTLDIPRPHIGYRYPYYKTTRGERTTATGLNTLLLHMEITRANLQGGPRRDTTISWVLRYHL